MDNFFNIYVSWQGKLIALNCEIIYESSQVQRIKVSKTGKSFILQNNYPSVKSSPPNKRPAILWKVTEGKPTDAKFLADVLRNLEAYIKEK